MTMIFYLTDCPTMELSEKVYSGSVNVYPTVLCMWKLIIWNHTNPYYWCTTRSHIGPTSFSDLHERCLEFKQSLQIYIVWDDTNLFSAIEYILPAHTSNVNELLNNELVRICEWLTVNRLSLSFMKTKYMLFHPTHNDISSLVISTATKLRGYTGFTLSVRPSVCPSTVGVQMITWIIFTGSQFDLGWDWIWASYHIKYAHNGWSCDLHIFGIPRAFDLYIKRDLIGIHNIRPGCCWNSIFVFFPICLRFS